jgi:hypothetical protein
MGGYSALIGIAALIFLYLIIWLFNYLISWLSNKWHEAKKYVELKPKLDNLNNYKAKLDSYSKQLEAHKNDISKQLETRKNDLDVLVKEKTTGFPWLAEAWSEYLCLQDLKKAELISYKSHPAPKAADQVREIAFQRRTAEKLHRILKYQLEYYENLFPFLVEFKGEDLDDLIKQTLEKGKLATKKQKSTLTQHGNGSQKLNILD